MIRREKILELMKEKIIIDLNTFGSKKKFTLKIINFENVPWTKVIHVNVIEAMNAWYTWYKINL